MGALTNARPKPQPDTANAQVVEPVADTVVDTTTAIAPPPAADPNHITTYDTDSLTKFMGMEPELPPLPAPHGAVGGAQPDGGGAQPDAGGAIGGAPAPDASPDTEDTRKWYQRWFTGRGADGPEQMEQDAEMDAEMYAMTAEATTEITDTALPMFIGRMHDRPAEDFKADEDQKIGLAKAWELYLRHKQMKVSPLQFLVFKIFIVYGVNFIMGMFAWVGRIGVYGFHLPWSDSWKNHGHKRFRKMQAEDVTVQQSVQHDQQPQNAEQERKAAPWETQPAPTPAPTPAPMPAPMPAPPIAPPVSPPIAPPRPVVNYRSCKSGSGKMFRAGSGFPKTGVHKLADKFPELVDSFINYPAFMAYSNKHALMGQGGWSKKSKAEA